MKWFFKYFLHFGIFLSVASCSLIKPVELLNSATPEEGYDAIFDIAYGDHPRQMLDIYKATDPVSGPLVVFIYGGAWRTGSKGEYKFLAQALADAGHTIIIPDYRLYPAVRYPEIVNDVHDAVRFVLANTEKLKLSSTDIVLMGHSSGAHAAAMLVSSDRYFRGEPFIKALIGLSGPYDLPVDLPEVSAVFGDVEDVSTIRPPDLVGSDHPDTLLLHGVDDERVLLYHTQRYAESLREASVTVETRYLDGVGHVDIIASLASTLDFLNSAQMYVLQFLLQQSER